MAPNVVVCWQAPMIDIAASARFSGAAGSHSPRKLWFGGLPCVATMFSGSFHPATWVVPLRTMVYLPLLSAESYS